MSIDRVRLGDLEVSAQGLGCMGMSEWYGAADWDESIATIHRALDLGVTLVDTADVYGAGHNEVLVGRAIHDRRDEVQLATKFGIDRTSGDQARVLRGDAGLRAPGLRRVPACAWASRRSTCTTCTGRRRTPRSRRRSARWPSSSRRARCDTSGCPRSTATCCAGRTRCTRSPRCRASTRCGPGTSRRRCSRAARARRRAWCRTRRSAGGSSPARSRGRRLGEGDFRGANPRFTGEAGDANQAIADAVARWPAQRGVTPAQVALAWVHGQGDRLGVPWCRSPAPSGSAGWSRTSPRWTCG